MMASVTHHEDGRTTFAPDGHPDDLLSAALRPRLRTRVLRPHGGYVAARSIVGPEPWASTRLIIVATIVIGVGVPLLLRML